MPVWISSKTSRAPAASQASRAAAIVSSPITCTPVSPWIGSSMTAAVRSPTPAPRAAPSFRGTGRNPGRYGAKLSLVASSGVAESDPMVRPWKAPSSTTISGSEIPRACACFRTSLIAHSLASVPELQRNARPPRLDSQSLAASRTPPPLRYSFEGGVNVPTWSRTAWTTAGWQCPTEQTEIPARKSRYRLPSDSQRYAPSPLTNSTGDRGYVCITQRDSSSWSSATFTGRSSCGDLGADTGVGEELEQQAMRAPPVDDVSGLDAAGDRVDAGGQLRPHAALDSVECRADLVGRRL